MEKKTRISQALVPGLNHTMQLPTSSPEWTSDMGCRLPVSWPDPLDHLLSSLSFSPVSCIDCRPSLSPCLCPHELLLFTGLPRQEPVPDSPPCLGPSMERPCFQDLALPSSLVSRSGAAPRGDSRLSPWLPALQEQPADTRPWDAYSKPGSQCRHIHQSHRRFPVTFPVVHFPLRSVAAVLERRPSVTREQRLWKRVLRRMKLQAQTVWGRYRRNWRSRKTFDIMSRVKVCVEGKCTTNYTKSAVKNAYIGHTAKTNILEIFSIKWKILWSPWK